jgi:hypothetical protein
MAVHQQFYLTCTDCGKQYIGTDGEAYGETEDEIKAIATDDGWHCDEQVQNGSDWDFCPGCYRAWKQPA